MTEVFFYHLEHSKPQDVLPSLLEKTLAKGWKALVKVPSEADMAALDEQLWTYREDSFLPHGTDGAEQPVLLTLTNDAVNGAEAVFLTPGTMMAPDDMNRFQRCILLFTGDGADAARQQWRILKNEGFEVTYWKQGFDGRWEKAGG